MDPLFFILLVPPLCGIAWFGKLGFQELQTLFRGRHSANADPTPPITASERCERFADSESESPSSPSLPTPDDEILSSTSGNRTPCATASATSLALDVRESDFRNPGDGSRPNDMNVLQTPASVQVHHALHPSYSAPDVPSHGVLVQSKRTSPILQPIEIRVTLQVALKRPASATRITSQANQNTTGQVIQFWFMSRVCHPYPGCSPGHGTPCSEDAFDIAKDIDSEDFFDVAKDTSHASVEAHPSVPAAGAMGPQHFTFSVPTSLTKPRTSAAVRYSLTPQHRARTRSRGHQSLSFPCCLQCQCSHQQQVTLSVDHPLLVQTGRASFADTTSETNVTDQSS
eukprot:g18177.t1